MTHPPYVGRHSFDLDCAHLDGPAYLSRWQRRWNCSCGAKGHWCPQAERLTYLEWREHAEALERLALTRLADGQRAVSA